MRIQENFPCFFSLVFQASTGKKLFEKKYGKLHGTQKFYAKRSASIKIQLHNLVVVDKKYQYHKICYSTNFDRDTMFFPLAHPFPKIHTYCTEPTQSLPLAFCFTIHCSKFKLQCPYICQLKLYMTKLDCQRVMYCWTHLGIKYPHVKIIF